MGEQKLGEIPKVSGDAGQVYLDTAMAKVLDEAEKIASKAGDSFVPVERILTALAIEKSGAKEALEAGGVKPQALNEPINGRDDEIRRSMQVLSRRTKNNPPC